MSRYHSLSMQILVLEVIGAALVVAGVGLFSVAAALIMAGVFVLAFGIALERVQRQS